MAEITLDDRAFQSGFASLTGRWAKNSQAGARRYADAVIERATAHIDSKSGELAGALKAVESLTGDEIALEIGAFEDDAADPHGLYTEFGTVHEAPRPFMRPALLEAERDFTVDP